MPRNAGASSSLELESDLNGAVNEAAAMSRRAKRRFARRGREHRPEHSVRSKWVRD
jgi:hypothetical protein